MEAEIRVAPSVDRRQKRPSQHTDRAANAKVREMFSYFSFYFKTLSRKVSRHSLFLISGTDSKIST
jgi:hypothetical protein